MKRYVLEEMIWPEVQEALSTVKVALVPVGSCEQHGPNGTFVVDSAISYETAKRLAERCGDKVLVFPPVTYGYSAHHMPFPGTVTLRVNTLTAVLVDIAVSISKHGFEKILFLNGHGGNNPSLMSAVQILKYEHKISAFWTSSSQGVLGPDLIDQFFPHRDRTFSGHADEIELSTAMFLRPDIVREKREAGIKQESIFNDCPNFVPGTQGVWNWKNDMTLNGSQGDARKASAELGEQMNEIIMERLEVLVDKIIRHTPTY